MAISINGTTGVITGVSEGGLPDGSVNTADIKDLSITGDKLGTGSVSADKIDSGAVTSAKLDSGVTSSIDAKAPLSQPEFTGNYVKVPVGDTASRPSAQAGMIRFNTDTNSMEQYDGSNWTTMAKPPIISSLSYPGSQTAVDPAGGETITISGANFTSGVNVKFGNTYATSVTRTNSTSLSVVVPALSADTYDVYVVNGDGMQATLSGGIEYNATPTFTTAAGSLGSVQNDQAITTITLVATETDGGAITYNVTTGALPTGLSLSGADITGTPTGYSAETTANFTITATDDENQTTTRNFSLTVLVGFYSYTLAASARFDGSTGYLNRTFTAGDQKTWTWSAWVKRGNTSVFHPFMARKNSSNSERLSIGFESDDTIRLLSKTGGVDVADLSTVAKFRDVGTWYHIVIYFDAANTTARIYVNGVEQDLNVITSVSNTNHQFNVSGAGMEFGSLPNDSTYFFDGYMAEVHYIDGTALTPSTFGETKNGVWIPKEVTGVTYGNNGFYLDFVNNVLDQSGNGTSWAANQLGSEDIGILDTPTNNFCTLDPLQSVDSDSSIEFSEGNLKANNTNASLWAGTYSTFGVSSGKWYWEWSLVEGDSTADFQSGIQIFDRTTPVDWDATSPQSFQGTILYYGDNGQKRINNSLTNYGSSYGNGDIIGVALDLDSATQTVTFYKNNVSQGAINLSLSTSEVVTVTPAFAHYIDAFVANFGQDSSFAGSKTRQNNTDENSIGDFYYTPPTGYLAICNENLPDDNTFELNDGENPSDHFDVVTYTGNGSTQSITGLGFQPDLIISKGLNTAAEWRWQDSIRGGDVALRSNTREYQTTSVAEISFDSDGYSFLDGSAHPNTNNINYVSYCFKGGGTAVSNTDGSVTSQVSANTSAGFSIVQYDGTGTNITVGHGLNKAPEVVICKTYSQTENTPNDGNWRSYFKYVVPSNPEQYKINLNDTSAYVSGSANWNNTAPTSTTFSVGTEWEINFAGENHIAYCFHSVEGYSKMGAYEGSNSTDGTFVYTGFKPAFVMMKNVDTTQSWIIFDNKRNSYNPETKAVYINLDLYEETWNNAVDFLSNGFKLRYAHPIMNSTYTYVYMAFAEDPFKYGNAR